jgi:glycerate 2-kinase
MRIVVAPDGFGGTLSAREAAAAIASGWRSVRPDDEVVEVPLSDGGEGLLDVVRRPDDRIDEVEVAGPLGHPVRAPWVLRGEVAIIESALACGLALLAPEQRDPSRTTTYGVGQLIHAAASAGARRMLIGLGGSATVDGGAGALSGLGFRLRVEDGSGLKIGGGELVHVARAERGWAPDLGDVSIEALCDVTTLLEDAAQVYGPQKGADSATVALLARGLERWAEVAERDLAGGHRVRDVEGTGAAGGLAFGLMCGIDARAVSGIDAVASLVGLDATMDAADLVVTGEGRLDATSFVGKVVGAVRDRAAARDLPVAAVVGGVGDGASPTDEGLLAVEEAAPDGPGPDPADEVARAAGRLAAGLPERLGR